MNVGGGGGGGGGIGASEVSPVRVVGDIDDVAFVLDDVDGDVLGALWCVSGVCWFVSFASDAGDGCIVSVCVVGVADSTLIGSCVSCVFAVESICVICKGSNCRGSFVDCSAFKVLGPLEALSDGLSDEHPAEGTDFNDACSSAFCCTSSCPSAISL